MKFLKKEGVLEEKSADGLSSNLNLLEPGLYGISGKFAFFLVFWNNETAYKEVSRKDPACNFIKYLETLCDELVAVVSEDEVCDLILVNVLRPMSCLSVLTKNTILGQCRS